VGVHPRPHFVAGALVGDGGLGSRLLLLLLLLLLASID
jgi:hypothetical protein